MLSANKRLARTLKNICARQRETAGCVGQITTFPVWFSQLWQRLQWQDIQLPDLISPFNQQYIFNQFAKEDGEYSTQSLTGKVTQQLSEAYDLCGHYLIGPQDFNYYDSEDVRLFKRTQQAFDQWCEKNNLIACVKALAFLISSPEHCSILIRGLAKKLKLVGYLQHSPLEQLFFEMLSGQGVQIEQFAIPFAEKNSKTAQLACTNRYDEWRQAFHYAQKAIQTDKQTIAIVVPDLQTHRKRIVWQLKQIFPGTPSFYNVAGGEPFSQLPMIAFMLDCLQLLAMDPTQPFDDQLFFKWLKSPFLQGALEERCARAQFYGKWCAESAFHWTLQEVFEQLNSVAPMAAQALALLLSVHSQRSDRTCSEWISWLFSWFVKVLINLNSEDQYGLLKFKEMTQELIQLSSFAPVISFSEFYGQLTFALSNKIFQLPSREEAPLQVLGLYEAIGLTFDHIWICHLDENSWPSPLNPNPFIPLPLQKNKRLPRADHAREMEYAKMVMATFVQQALTCIVSFTAIEQGLIQKSTICVRAWPQASRLDILSWAEQLFQQRPSLIETEDYGRPLDLVEMGVVEGGVGIFKAQAECPFKAYAKYRLKLLPLESPNRFLDYRLRGVILHDALERLFKEGYHAALKDNLLAVVDPVLFQYQRQYRWQLSPGFIALERTRLLTLLEEWLDIEKQRDHFKVIGHEKKVFGRVGALSLKLRVDRVDRLEDGSRVVIDYKTGRVDKRDWQGERPLEPQLPLYALLTQTQAIAFAKLRVGEMGYQGLCHKVCGIEGIVPLEEDRFNQHNNWQEQLDAWQSTLEKLAEAYVTGKACIDPKHTSLCQKCVYHAFCRINSTKGCAK